MKLFECPGFFLGAQCAVMNPYITIMGEMAKQVRHLATKVNFWSESTSIMLEKSLLSNFVHNQPSS